MNFLTWGNDKGNTNRANYGLVVDGSSDKGFAEPKEQGSSVGNENPTEPTENDNEQTSTVPKDHDNEQTSLEPKKQAKGQESIEPNQDNDDGVGSQFNELNSAPVLSLKKNNQGTDPHSIYQEPNEQQIETLAEINKQLATIKDQLNTPNMDKKSLIKINEQLTLIYNSLPLRKDLKDGLGQLASEMNGKFDKIEKSLEPVISSVERVGTALDNVDTQVKDHMEKMEARVISNIDSGKIVFKTQMDSAKDEIKGKVAEQVSNSNEIIASAINEQTREMKNALSQTNKNIESVAGKNEKVNSKVDELQNTLTEMGTDVGKVKTRLEDAMNDHNLMIANVESGLLKKLEDQDLVMSDAMKKQLEELIEMKSQQLSMSKHFNDFNATLHSKLENMNSAMNRNQTDVELLAIKDRLNEISKPQEKDNLPGILLSALCGVIFLVLIATLIVRRKAKSSNNTSAV